MACWSSYTHLPPHNIRFSLASLFIPKTSIVTSSEFPLTSVTSSFSSLKSSGALSASVAPSTTTSSSGGGGGFTWDDAVRISQPEYAPEDSSDLSGFFEKIRSCNRRSELQSDFVPFGVDGRIVGYIHHGFVEHLRRFEDVFVFPHSDSYGGRFGFYVTLDEMLKAPEERTRAVGEVTNCLGEENLIPGIRNELYPVTSSFGAPIYFSLERAAAPYFGTKAYGVHMNGFVEIDGKQFLWIGKRSQMKPTYPGMLDHLVAGGLPSGISCGENLVKECEEEAGIPRSLSHKAIPVGAVSYVDIEGCRYKRDVLFCYDLQLPEGFIPKNQDGEVESFKLIPVANVGNIIRKTHFFKPNCSLVIIDFLFRHGYIRPECLGYLDLLQSLRTGDCS